MRRLDGGRQDDPHMGIDPIALGKDWGSVRPFVLKSGKQFRTPPPPALDSAEYSEAFNEVLALGGDGSSRLDEELGRASAKHAC